MGLRKMSQDPKLALLAVDVVLTGELAGVYVCPPTPLQLSQFLK